MASRPKPEASAQGTEPKSFPATTPPSYSQPGHDFTLQAVMEMQKNVGELVARTDRLISDVKSQGDKIDNLRIRFAWVTGGAVVVGALISIFLAALRILPGGWFGVK
jgi:hypothetical protein